jgi:isocitrate/isopropylmalate dehydrogenase
MRIAVIPGDGVGPEVTREAVKVLGAIGRAYGLAIESETLPYGADYYLQTGTSLPAGAFRMLPDQFDAILLGALGTRETGDYVTRAIQGNAERR